MQLFYRDYFVNPLFEVADRTAPVARFLPCSLYDGITQHNCRLFLDNGFLPVIKQYLTYDLTDSESEEPKEEVPAPAISYQLDETGKWTYSNIKYSSHPPEDVIPHSKPYMSSLFVKDSVTVLNHLFILQLTAFFNSVCYFRGTFLIL
jgi:hypothetical protein